MFRSEINGPFNAILLATFLCLAMFAVACSKSEQPSSNSPGSSPSTGPGGGGDFEGLIAMKMDTVTQTSAEMTYYLKGNHTRIETRLPNVPEGSAVMLWDLEGSKIVTLMPSRKMYMTMDMKAAAEDMKQMKKSHGQEDPEFPKLTPTGKQETIAGHTCEHWLMGDNQEIDMCVAKGLGYFGMGGQSGGGLASLKNLAFSPKMLAAAASHPEWVKFLNGGAFPLKLSAMKDGKVTMTIEATRIEKKPLDDSLFVIPTDYKEFSIPNIPASTGSRQ